MYLPAWLAVPHGIRKRYTLQLEIRWKRLFFKETAESCVKKMISDGPLGLLARPVLGGRKVFGNLVCSKQPRVHRPSHKVQSR